jgi:hypothetical protein
MTEQSNEIDKLAGALAKAQGKITGALKDSSNPFFKSKYADLAACWDACRAQLSENGLSVIQLTDIDAEGVTVITTLAHESGQWMRGKLRLMPKDPTAQAVGSAITYARRYALAAIVGLAQVDDDGNEASGRSTGQQGYVHSPKPEGWQAADSKKATEYKTRIMEAINEGRDVLELWDEVRSGGEEFATAVWVKLSGPVKDHIKDEVARREKSSAA